LISLSWDGILYDTGNFKIGDTLTEGEITVSKVFQAPSILDTSIMLTNEPNSLTKGLTKLMDEGVAQLFTLEMNTEKLWNGGASSVI
jgi:peptide chain release factor 3